MSGVLSAIVPVFLIAAVGYVVCRRFRLDAHTLSTLNVYVFIPALVFGDPAKRQIEWPLLGRFALAMALLIAVMTIVLTVIARARNMTPEQTGAFLMTMFTNVGNFGLPVVTFAFGKGQVLSWAILIMICGSFMQNTVGVYFAQRSRHGVWKACGRVLQFPMLYAFLLMLLFNRTGWHLPAAIRNAVEITADAAIPAQLIILGATLAETRLDSTLDVFLACACRLCLGPAVALAAAWAVGLEGLAMKVFMLQLSGPVAVGMAVYGVQFQIRPGYLASVVSWSFLLSLFTVAAVLAGLYAMP